MSDVHGTTLAVLAGGKGSRMGGPKHRLRVKGVPMCTYLIRRLAWPGPTMLVLAEGGQVPADGHVFGTIVHDQGGGSGPLRAAATAVECAPTETTILLPVDMPLVEQVGLQWLAAALADREDAIGIILSRQRAEGTQIEPFPCIFRRSASTLLRARLGRGELSMRDLATGPRVMTVPAPASWPEMMWTNLNAPGDLPEWVTISDSH